MVEIELVNPLLICVLYIPPNASSDYRLHILHFIESISSKSPCIIVGDFNFSDINWSTLDGQSPLSVAFCDLIFRLNLTQLVDFPTHSSGNTLDLVISDSTELIQNLFSFSSDLLQSDHFTITFTVSVHNSKKKKPKHPPSYNFKRTDLNALSDFLLDCNFNLLMESTNIEFVWSSLKNLILEAILHSTPITRARRTPYPKWFDSNIRHKINKLRSLRKLCRRKPSPDNLLKVSFEEIQLQDNISFAKSEFENNLVYSFAFNHDHKIYRYIRNLSGQSQLPATMYFGSEEVSEDVDKANFFNRFFHSVFNDRSTLPSYESSTIPADSLSSISISIHDTWDALVTLDTTKAMGCDGIPPLILKHAATALVDPIHYLFNLCISQSYLPSEWRSHLITPIPKSGDRSNIENYRPISLLCSISKVLEKIIFDKVSNFILNHTISLSQFGFIKKRSTVQQLLLYCDLLSNALHKHH